MAKEDKKSVLAPEKFTSELSKSVHTLGRLVEKDSTKITLWVSHSSLSAEAISDALQLKPDFSNGESEKVLRDGKTHWTFSSEGKVPTGVFEDHLKWMLDQLFGKLPAIRSLQDQGADFKLEVFTEQWSPIAAMSLRTETIQHIFQLRVPLVFMIHHNEITAG